MQKLTAHGLTDVGLQRAHNEDTFAIAQELDFFVVCDGMGGHASGEVASRICAENAVAFIHKNQFADPSDFPFKTSFERFQCSLISNAVQYANERVYIEGMKDSKLEGMGTTIVAIRALEDEVVAVHVGDSRIYRWRQGGKLEQLTRDHSLLNFKIDRGELTTPTEIANFKQGNVIVRAIGLKDEVVPEVQVVSRRPGDIFLLCSDGLTDLVDDWSIENVLEANYDELDEACGCLIRMANDRGGKDNITVLLVRVDDLPADDELEEATDPSGITALTEATEPRGIAAVDDDFEDAIADTDPRMRRINPPVSEDEDDDWYSDDFEVDYRDEDISEDVALPEDPPAPTRKDRGKSRSVAVTSPSMRRAPAARYDPKTSPTSDAPDYLDDDSPIRFGQVPGRLAARRAPDSSSGSKPMSHKTPATPHARESTSGGASGSKKGSRRPETTAPSVRKVRQKPAPTDKGDGGDGLPSIIIDDSLLE